MTYICTEQKRRLPRWAHKSILQVVYRQQPLGSGWSWINVTKISVSRTGHANHAPPPLSVTIHITVLRSVQLSTQLVSVSAFCGSVIYQEMGTDSAIELEPFAAVGQWGNVVVVLLVLLAAGLSRIWSGGRDESLAAETRKLEEGSERGSEGGSARRSKKESKRGSETWDSRIGYASLRCIATLSNPQIRKALGCTIFVFH